MNRFFYATAFALAIFSANKSFGTDSTNLKRSLLSFSAGLNNNSVYGSMVQRNIEFGRNVKMEEKTGFLISLHVENNLSRIFFLKTGLDFIHKQVNPMVNTFAIYKDTLKTNYLSIPVEFGINLLPFEKPVNIAFFVGTLTNIRITDNSTTGPDRVAFKTIPLSESLSAGAKLSFWADSKSKLFFEYKYLYDLTTAYVETLYWSSLEPRKEFTYRYKTQAISLGFCWVLK